MKTRYDTLSVTAQAYNTKVTIEHPMDLDIYELLDIYKKVTVGLSFSEDMWKDAVIALATEYQEESSYAIPNP